MNLAGHITELRRKHESLARTIEEEQRRPAMNDLELSRLKREKLKLKEEIVRLSPAIH
ncbi:DUF465 domain-containing protein [uncultured Albimonas sp.]|uniref:YdcH family protein n=1 Tax=uncultured Albimonas sp. TaxID=1331701 RepID=UPI0030EE1CCA|tara:strand:+ start:222 stop:395 length:174 start_codon:yes stop_codon:yes gene_type:complete